MRCGTTSMGALSRLPDFLHCYVKGRMLMSELQYQETAAAGYDQGVGCMTRQVVPSLLRIAHLMSGNRVLDIAAGTGLAAEAAATAVAPSGHITAADISPAMLEHARGRLAGLTNVALMVE